MMTTVTTRDMFMFIVIVMYIGVVCLCLCDFSYEQLADSFGSVSVLGRKLIEENEEKNTGLL